MGWSKYFIQQAVIWAAAGHRFVIDEEASRFTQAKKKLKNESLMIASRKWSAFQEVSNPMFGGMGDLQAQLARKAKEREARQNRGSGNEGNLRSGKKTKKKNSGSGGIGDRANALAGKLPFGGPPKKFGGIANQLEGRLPFGKKGPPGGSNSSGCAEKDVCKSYIKQLKEKASCPTRNEKQLMGNIRRALLGEEGAGTVSEAVEKVKERLTNFHPMANPNPMTLEEAGELIKHPTGRLWELIESEKGTAEMWCQGGGKLAVEMPKEVRKIPDAVAPGHNTPVEEVVVDTMGPIQRAESLFTAQNLFREQASIGNPNGTVREAGLRTIVKLVQADPAPANQKSRGPAKAKKHKGPKPYGLAAIDGKLDQNLGLMLRKLDFSVKQNPATAKWFKKGQVDYLKMFEGLFSGIPAIVGDAGNRDSARNTEIMLTAMNQIPDDDAAKSLLDAAEADDVLKIVSPRELYNAAPGGLKPSAAFIRAWARHRAQNPQKVAKCILSRFSEPKATDRGKKVLKYINNYYPVLKKFSQHVSDAISQYISAFSSAGVYFHKSEYQMSAAAKKDYGNMEDRLVKLSTIKGLKDKLANKGHPLAGAVLPLLAIANVFNKGDFNLRAGSGQDPRWKPSILDTFLYFAARTSNHHHRKKGFAFIHSLTGDDAKWNGRMGKLMKPGKDADSWNVGVPKMGLKRNVKEANLAVYKSLLDLTMEGCKKLMSKGSTPTWGESIGGLLQDLKSLSKELGVCTSVRLPSDEDFNQYIRNVEAALGQLEEAHSLLVDALGPVYLSLLPDDVYDGSSVNMVRLGPKILLWQKMVIGADDKAIPHPQPFVSLFDDYTLRSNIHNFCVNVGARSKLAWSEHFHLRA